VVAEWMMSAALAVAFALRPLRPLRRPLPAPATPAPRRSALILNGAALTKAALTKAQGELGAGEFEVVFRRIDELAFTIEPGAVAVHETVSGRYLADFAFVQVASFPNPTGTLLNAVAAYLRHQGVDVVNAEGIGAPTRLLQYVRFAQAGMPVPSTRYLPPWLLADAYPDLADELGLPFVLTALRRGAAGRKDFLIGDEPGFAEPLRVTSQPHYLAQEFVPADAIHHVLVLGREVPIVLRQDIGFGEPCLATIPVGGQLSLVDAATFDPCARLLAVQAASLMGLDVAAVRLAAHWMTGEWYVLETCATPPFSAGAFIPDQVSAYTAYLQGKLDAVTRVARQDRRPRCRGRAAAVN
jgi:glutathione synthase/RimK-type ligase-like ATP-grasp enzyme